MLKGDGEYQLFRVAQLYIKWTINSGDQLYVAVYFDQVESNGWLVSEIDTDAAHLTIWNDWVPPQFLSARLLQKHMRLHLEQCVREIPAEDHVLIAAFRKKSIGVI